MSKLLLSLLLALTFAVASTAGVVVWGSGANPQPSADDSSILWGT